MPARVFSLLAAAAHSATALTDAEIAKFVSRGCAVQHGACSGIKYKGEITLTKDGDELRIVTNGIPDHPTCASTTAAGETCYDDPLTTWFEPQSTDIRVPLNPTKASSTTVLPAAMAAVAINGVAIFSAFSLPCTDAVKDEAIGFDDYLGHPQEQGAYHYHTAAFGLDGYKAAWEAQEPFLLGVAYDGFPIYTAWKNDGTAVAESELDACHGYDSEDGYRYIASGTFPYTLGCYTGTPIETVSPHCPDGVQTGKSMMLQGPGGSTQDGCDTACVGDACDESGGAADCPAQDNCYCSSDCGTGIESAALPAACSTTPSSPPPAPVAAATTQTFTATAYAIYTDLTSAKYTAAVKADLHDALATYYSATTGLSGVALSSWFTSTHSATVAGRVDVVMSIPAATAATDANAQAAINDLVNALTATTVEASFGYTASGTPVCVTGCTGAAAGLAPTVLVAAMAVLAASVNLLMA